MALPIEHLHVVGYRGLSDVTIERPARVNLLVGPNNAGKTSVLEALASYARPLDPVDWMDVARSRAPLGARKAWVDALRWLFPRPLHREADAPRLCIEGVGRHRVTDVTALLEEREQEVVATRAEEDAMPGALERDSGVRLMLSASIENPHAALFQEGFREVEGVEATFWEQTPWERPRIQRVIGLPHRLVTPYSHRVERVQIRTLSALLAAGGRDAITDVLRRFDPEVSGIELLDPSGRFSEIYLRHARLGLPPLASFGDGMRRIAALVLAIVAARGGVLLIDEIETCLHTQVLTWAFERLAAMAGEYDVQIFATTHSLEAIDAILDAFAEDDTESLATYHLARKDGAVTTRRYSTEDVRYLRHERALDLR